MAYDHGKIIKLIISVYPIVDLQTKNEINPVCKLLNIHIHLSLLIGINYFDICDPSGTDRAEQEIGRIVRKKGWNRRSYVISTRVYWHRCAIIFRINCN